jgi:dipeptidyl aminopeptidase/acylaminoacyl peptidase
VFAAVAVTLAFAAATPAVAAAAPDDPPTIGTYGVGVVERTFVDRTRVTPANGDAPEAPQRTLDTVVYYPARSGADDRVVAGAAPVRRGGPYPLVLFSHGNNSFGREYEALFRQWVSAGYVVAAPNYPLSQMDAPGGTTVSDVGNQAGDAAFVLDEVLALNRERGPLRGLVDPKRVAAAGHSLGAITTYNLAFKACCADTRIEAVAVMSGVSGTPPEYFDSIDTPLLVLHGDADRTIEIRNGVDAFERANPPKYFVTLIGGLHSEPYRGADDAVAVAATTITLDFFDRYLKGDEAGLTRMHRDAIAGVASLQEEP